MTCRKGVLSFQKFASRHSPSMIVMYTLMSTSSDKPFLIVQIARNAEQSQETDLHLITIILNLCIGIVVENVKALCSKCL